ncbi:hypothetical protein Q669_07020 [Labrenzia sp. C1B10]|uniref:DUF6716 putative glycosyltransferase n=1 Tax=unclassified Labrenzia TaxID=2648686 RepID=UPI0003B853EE|nr:MULTISPECIES: DUF6716 putative glycosyltransferase [unclassified Labrenzia]ERP88194.1 hypothetical protein Q669_07020 [Labrenzia sp. C1B10]ERP99861.1 hypothetical protein Q675_14900 [Labrenzia sp. C1B70]
MRVLALAGFDSFLNTVRLIAPHFEVQGASVDFALVSARKKKQISAEQIMEMGFINSIPAITIKDLCQSGAIKPYDIVLSCLEGMSTRHLFHYLEDLGNARPLVICIYPGLVLRYAYDGFSMRAPADLLWLNCKKDVEAYTAMCDAFGHVSSNARLFGNASLLERIDRKPDADETGPIVFFEQAIIPRYYHERKFLVEQLFALAKRFPQKTFLIKARAVGSKATLHRTWHSIDSLFREVGKENDEVPRNIRLTEERAPRLLAKASHCLTISSTVAVEAINAGVPTTLISDFGAHDDYGLQYFYGSGLLRSFEQLDFEKPFHVNSKWREEFAFDPGQSINQLIAEALDRAEKNHFPQTLTARNCEGSTSFRNDLLAKGTKFYLSRAFKSKRNIVQTLISTLKQKATGRK